MQIKFGSVKLAKVYMKRVAAELQSKEPLDKDTSMDYMLLQGVRFAFRIHQVCQNCTHTQNIASDNRILLLMNNRLFSPASNCCDCHLSLDFVSFGTVCRRI